MFFDTFSRVLSLVVYDEAHKRLCGEIGHMTIRNLPNSHNGAMWQGSELLAGSQKSRESASVSCETHKLTMFLFFYEMRVSHALASVYCPSLIAWGKVVGNRHLESLQSTCCIGAPTSSAAGKECNPRELQAKREVGKLSHGMCGGERTYWTPVSQTTKSRIGKHLAWQREFGQTVPANKFIKLGWGLTQLWSIDVCLWEAGSDVRKKLGLPIGSITWLSPINPPTHPTLWHAAFLHQLEN